MKAQIKLLFAIFLLAVLTPLAHAQQYTLNQTTLSAKVAAGDTQIQVASATGIYG